MTPAYLERVVVDTVAKYEVMLRAGALITIDEGKARVRILPFTQ